MSKARLYGYASAHSRPEVLDFYVYPGCDCSDDRPSGTAVFPGVSTTTSGYYTVYVDRYVRYCVWLRNAGCWASPCPVYVYLGFQRQDLDASCSKGAVDEDGIQVNIRALDGMDIQQARAEIEKVRAQPDYSIMLEICENREDGGERERIVTGGYIIGKPLDDEEEGG